MGQGWRRVRRILTAVIVMAGLAAGGVTVTATYALDQDVTIAKVKRMIRLVQSKIAENLFGPEDPNRIIEAITIIQTRPVSGTDPFDPLDPGGFNNPEGGGNNPNAGVPGALNACTPANQTGLANQFPSLFIDSATGTDCQLSPSSVASPGANFTEILILRALAGNTAQIRVTVFQFGPFIFQSGSGGTLLPPAPGITARFDVPVGGRLSVQLFHVTTGRTVTVSFNVTGAAVGGNFTTLSYQNATIVSQ